MHDGGAARPLLKPLDCLRARGTAFATQAAQNRRDLVHGVDVLRGRENMVRAMEKREQERVARFRLGAAQARLDLFKPY